MLKSIPRAAAAALMITFPLLGFTAPANSEVNRPVSGGTLRLIAASGPDHIDPVSAYYTADYILERAYARQLMSYPSVPDPSVHSPGWYKDTTPVADVATTVPTVANGGITDGGTTYMFHIKEGVEWNTNPPRQVTANDFLREFKVFCNPAPGAFVGNLSYYSRTIRGLTSYCNQEAAYFPRHAITARNLARFQNSHSISGISVPNPATIRFHLYAPASDFLDILALPFASARPVEYDAYLPNSLQLDQHTISDGPYQITSFVPGLSTTMVRNRAWKQSTDPVRHQYAKKITLTIGIVSAETQIADLRSGRFDLMDDTAVPPGDYQRLRRDRDFHIWPGENLIPYVVLNFRSPNSGHAIRRLDVRRAIEFGINKAAVQKALGGPALEPILNSVLGPGNVGALTKNPYPSPGGRGNATRCRALLTRAGFRHGLTLRYMYINDSTNSRIFAAIQAGLRIGCGITLIPKPEPGSVFFTLLSDTRLSNKPRTWDLAQPGWIPDWYGNGARSIMDPLFRTHCVVNTNNYGCYSSRLVDRLISDAENARSLAAAAGFWLRANRQIMNDAAFVPLVDGQNPIYASPLVHEAGLPHGVAFLPVIGGPDVTNVWVTRR